MDTASTFLETRLPVTTSAGIKKIRVRSHQSLAAANICTINSGRLYVTDRVRKERYLVDSGSDLCGFTRKLLTGAWNAQTKPSTWPMRTPNPHMD